MRRGSIDAIVLSADQLLFSGSNVLFLILVSRTSTPSEFGEFSLAYVSYILTVGLTRSAVTDPLLTGHLEDGASLSERRGPLLAAGAFGGMLGSAVLLALGTVWLDEQAVVFSMALALPVVALQDVYRAIYFHRRKAQAALTIDAIFVSVQFPVTALLLLTSEDSAHLCVIAWGAGAFASVIWAAMRGDGLPTRGALNQLRRQRGPALNMAAEFSFGQGSLQLLLLGTGTVLGSAALASIRIVQVAFGPVNALVQGAFGWAVPRLAVLDGKARLALAWKVAAGLASIAGLTTIALLAMPHGIVESAVGPSWGLVSPELLLVMGVERCLSLATSVIVWAGKVGRRTGALAVLQAAQGLLGVPLALALGHAYGPVGVPAALAVAAAGALFAATVLAGSPRDAAST